MAGLWKNAEPFLAKGVQLLSDVSLNLFQPAVLLERSMRVVETAIPESYWEPLRQKVMRMEQSWKNGQN